MAQMSYGLKLGLGGTYRGMYRGVRGEPLRNILQL